MEKRSISIFMISIFTSIIMLFVSIITTKVIVYHHDDLKHVKLGYPFPFLLQNQRDIDPPFPWSTGLVSVFDNPTQILFGPMVASFAFYFILSFILLYLITGIRSKHRVR